MAKNKELTRVPVNLWDDYDDEADGTHAYVEEYDRLTEAERTEVMAVVYAFLLTLDLEAGTVSQDGDTIDFDPLPHERREELVKEVRDAGLTWRGVPIDFYSES